jgi:predicted nucleic acid-binding Zn ribbon protein
MVWSNASAEQHQVFHKTTRIWSKNSTRERHFNIFFVEILHLFVQTALQYPGLTNDVLIYPLSEISGI